ncbi:hypothetical protein IFM89_005456 [Coptis chinensis]|uniref:Uncharacterized protein n=1 Tax=Coptis chinensis TaxID=261450 RepID=A0A835IA69_9MAGN|nr:hypothetical protein IFM89_005456 [Coptis chinensis]
MVNPGKLSQKVISLAAGEAHTLALTGDGCVYSWGRGTFGRLGTGKEDDELFPVRVEFDKTQGDRPKFVEIAAGAYHSLALQGLVLLWLYVVVTSEHIKWHITIHSVLKNIFNGTRSRAAKEELCVYPLAMSHKMEKINEKGHRLKLVSDKPVLRGVTHAALPELMGKRYMISEFEDYDHLSVSQLPDIRES